LLLNTDQMDSPMRIFSLLLAVLLSLSLHAQTPPDGLSGEALRSWIKQNYYDGHHDDLGYTEARHKLFGLIDNYDDEVECVYGGVKDEIVWGSEVTHTDLLNTEHSIPQSWFGSASPMRSDIHHLFPTYDLWNNKRGSLPFVDIDDSQTDEWLIFTSSQSSIPGSNIDSYSELKTNVSFEPREQHKGNLARAAFYFYTMYPTQAGSIDDLADVALLYQWHLDDPADVIEIERNNRIETYQGNRNPYIDHPDWIARAWEIAEPGVPATPANFTLLADSNIVNLSWSDVDTELGYRIYRRIDSGTYVLVAEPGANAQSYTDNLTLNGAYSYYILAWNENGSSPPTDILTYLFSDDLEIDISGWTIRMSNGNTHTFPSNTLVRPGDYILLARDANQSAFEDEFAVSFGANIHFYSGNNQLPFVNGNYSFELFDSDNALVDATIVAASGTYYERTLPAADGTNAGSWTTVTSVNRTPGSNGINGTPGKIYFSEMADHSPFQMEYLELYVQAQATGGIGRNTLKAGDWALINAFPNPFNPSVKLNVELLTGRHVTATVFDNNGRLVEVLFDGRMAPGLNRLQWHGRAYASGVYFIVLQSVNLVKAHKLVLIK
jgi:hypothetical protein